MNPLESEEVQRKQRRLPRVEFGTGALEAAQVERHLADETVAATLGKSVKTWQRWRRGNYVHEDMAPRVIELLDVQPLRPLRRVPSGEELDVLAAQVRRLQDALDEFGTRLDAIERRRGRRTS